MKGVVAVTGANGAIGSAICRTLRDGGAGHLVIELTRRNLGEWKDKIKENVNHVVFAHGTDDHEKLMEVNYELTGEMTDYALEHCRGRCINICSRQALKPCHKEKEYAASKAAIHAEYMAHYANGHNVTSICPGWVDTTFQSDLRTAGMTSISTDEVASFVKWLCDHPHVKIDSVLMEAE